MIVILRRINSYDTAIGFKTKLCSDCFDDDDDDERDDDVVTAVPVTSIGGMWSNDTNMTMGPTTPIDWYSVKEDVSVVIVVVVFVVMLV